MYITVTCVDLVVLSHVTLTHVDLVLHIAVCVCVCAIVPCCRHHQWLPDSSLRPLSRPAPLSHSPVHGGAHLQPRLHEIQGEPELLAVWWWEQREMKEEWGSILSICLVCLDGVWLGCASIPGDMPAHFVCCCCCCWNSSSLTMQRIFTSCGCITSSSARASFLVGSSCPNEWLLPDPNPLYSLVLMSLIGFTPSTS